MAAVAQREVIKKIVADMLTAVAMKEAAAAQVEAEEAGRRGRRRRQGHSRHRHHAGVARSFSHRAAAALRSFSCRSARAVSPHAGALERPTGGR